MPLGYLLTFGTYGSRLQGDGRGTVHPSHAGFDTPTLPPDAELEARHRGRLAAPPVTLAASHRQLVVDAVVEVSTFRGWTLHAVHARPAHVHVVVSGPVPPERMLTDFKVYASRALNRAGRRPTWWQRHGSTEYLWTEESVVRAAHYTLEEQGELLERWPA